ncbi:hypothetical protein [Dyadobacter frigoris]|uniref:Uncharacterized protein n=1 Tax=Dyadobacter frigoris TaxID=2576211 RepID=A0A4U6D6H5_9BACT|nr:hypothetical protein [Dyadobacter frigoris]TKT89684.1 hypothetical protein FDK13_22790 [Dyadobacter frigoris]GLU54094.1 hypothetical protein Dfri01_35550 [Dyadobacter frigoris]
MKRKQSSQLDFIVDKLTNSIENARSGDSFPTSISLLTSEEIKGVNKKSEWRFDWHNEINRSKREVFKLTIANNPKIIQGIISLEVKPDHIYMHLIESAPFNIGRDKTYFGVPGNLVAFACQYSFQHANDGYVSFIAKTALINHYIDTLGAINVSGHLMVINTKTALDLIQRYFQN